MVLQGSKKVLSGCPGQADFLPGQVTFKFTCPMGKGLSKSSSNKIINYNKQEVVPGKQNVEAAWPKDKLEFKFFASPL